ncbi:MAG: hypothetical protein MZW92_13905 [Comamonadaceae bacterium]|nr:hypothetical protein [Comamonadaceae bacterium]
MRGVQSGLQPPVPAPMPRPDDDPTADERTVDPGRIATVATALRAGLVPLLKVHAGSPPRPYRLTQGLGLDKSLASRVVQAARAESDLDLLHQVPSPTGLRMLLDRAAPEPGDPRRRPLERAIRAFEELLDSLPGGRRALDGADGRGLGRDPRAARADGPPRRLKSQSFLFGHFCETLTTALVPRLPAAPGRVDAIEVHRRLGLQRLVPSMAVPLLSVGLGPDDGDAPQLLPLGADRRARRSRTTGSRPSRRRWPG